MSHSKLVSTRRKKQRTEKVLAASARRAKKVENTPAVNTKAAKAG